MIDPRFYAPLCATTRDQENVYMALLEVPAPAGLLTVEPGTSLIPLFTDADAAKRVGIDVERCVRPRLSALVEVLGPTRCVVVDPGGSPMLVTNLQALTEQF